MKSTENRFRKIKLEVNAYEDVIKEVQNEIEETSAVKPRDADVQAVLDNQNKALVKCGKNLINVLAAVRGHKLEAEVTLRELTKERKILSDRPFEKMADIATLGKDGKTRVVQTKSYSGHDNAGVNDHIQEALKQIFGSKGEIPAPGAKMTVLVEINSGKCFWPFTQTTYAKSPPVKRHFVKKATYANASKETCDVTSYVKWAYDAAVAKRKKLNGSKKDPEIREYGILNKFLKGLRKSSLQLIVIYKKQLGIDPKTSKKMVLDRSEEGPVKKVVIELKLDESGDVKIGTIKPT